MYYFFHRKIFPFCFVALVILADTTQAAIVRYDPITSTVKLGDTFFVDVVGEDFPNTEGGGINLSFDHAVINAVSVSIDNVLWGFVNDEGTIDNGGGLLSEILVSAFPGVSTGYFAVATIEFKAIGGGISDLLLSGSVMNPWAGGAKPINPEFNNGSVTVAAVPVPAALWLFVSGLIGLLGVVNRC